MFARILNLTTSFGDTSSPRIAQAIRYPNSSLDEAPDECERRVSDVSPAAVNRQRVPAIGDRDNLSNADIPLLTLERRVRDLPRALIFLLTRDNQQRPPLWALNVDICLRPPVEVR